MSDIFGVIAPHPPIIVAGVGGSRREPAAHTIQALGALGEATTAFEPDTIVLMSPHAPALADAITVDGSDHLRGSLGDFGDPMAHVWDGDPELATVIARELNALGTPTVLREDDARLRPGWLDHGSLVPLSFIDPAHLFRLVIISLSYLPYPQHRSIGVAIGQAAETLGRRIMFVASGDLSHRLTRDAPAGYSERAGELDARIVECVTAGQFRRLGEIGSDLVEAGGECGLRSFIAMGGFAGQDPVVTRVLSYEGPWGVGYLSAVVGQAGIDALGRGSGLGLAKGGSAGHDEAPIVALARATIEAYVAGRALPEVTLPPVYPRRAGAFVSLHIGDALRGCIGTTEPTQPTLAEEVRANAIAAATRDPRFEAVGESEAGILDISVDVLHEPEPCDVSDLDPARFGVIVTCGWRRGLLLPDLEGVNDVETQVRIARAKAGIEPQDVCSYERFRVDRYT